MAKFEFIKWLIDWLLGNTHFDFEWDSGNVEKSKSKHDVDFQEAQEIFYDPNIIPLGIQVEPVVDEPRFGVLGSTIDKRHLFVAFTIREGKIRVISARVMNRKEKALYEKNS